jgi:hypothetical protein
MANAEARALKEKHSQLALNIKNREREDQRLAQIAALSCKISLDVINTVVTEIVRNEFRPQFKTVRLA